MEFAGLGNGGAWEQLSLWRKLCHYGRRGNASSPPSSPAAATCTPCERNTCCGGTGVDFWELGPDAAANAATLQARLAANEIHVVFIDALHDFESVVPSARAAAAEAWNPGGQRHGDTLRERTENETFPRPDPLSISCWRCVCFPRECGHRQVSDILGSFVFRTAHTLVLDDYGLPHWDHGVRAAVRPTPQTTRGRGREMSPPREVLGCKSADPVDKCGCRELERRRRGVRRCGRWQRRVHQALGAAAARCRSHG